MLVGEVIYVSSAKTVATVVSSLITICFADVTVLQAPSAVIIRIAALLVPAASPGFPPLAVIKTSVPGVGQLKAGSEKVPEPSLTTAVPAKSGVDADPSPVVPTAYSWIVDPVIGTNPPSTVPEVAAAAVTVKVAALVVALPAELVKTA
jgi:hypothetical protein